MKNSRLPKHDNKVDKGFELFYFKLSYRRKFIRTIWLGAFGVVVLLLMIVLKLFLPDFSKNFNWFTVVLSAVIFSVVLVVQLIYNYIMWKSKEKIKRKSE